jgi:hypothetical protein
LGRLITDLGEEQLALTNGKGKLMESVTFVFERDIRRWPPLLATGDDALLGGLDTSITRVIVIPKVAANLIHI